jgi:hypothetical protein
LPKIKNLQLCKKASPNLKDIFEILMNIGQKTRFRPFEQFSSQTNQHVFKMDVRQDTTGVDLGIWKSISCCLVLP